MADPAVDISSMPPPPPDGSPLLSTQDVSQSADISGMPSPESMFTQQVGRAPEPAELAHWKTNPEDFAGGQQFAPSAGAQTMGAIKGMAGLGEATLSQATGATSGVVGGFLAHVGTLLATQDPEAAKAVRDSVSSTLTYSPRSTAGQAINDVPSQVVTAAFKAAHGPQAVAAVDTAARAQFGDAVVDPIKAGLGMAGEAAMAVPGAGMLAGAVGKTAGVAERVGARTLSSFKDPEAVAPAPAAAPPKLTPGPITAESLKTEPNRLATPAPAAPAEAAGAPGAPPAAPTEAAGAPGAAPAAPTEAVGAPGAAPAAPTEAAGAPGAAPAAPAPAPPKAPPAPRFTAPDQPGPPSAAPHPVTQITRQNALQHLNEDSGGQLPEVRTSALTGDYTESGHDFQHAKSPDAGGARMSDVIAGENNALKVASQKTTDPAITGGQAAGVDQAALAQRGETIDKALSGIGDWFDKNISDTYKQADAAAGGRPITNFSNTQKLLGDPTNFVGTQEGEALHRGAVARAQSLGLMGQDGAWKPATVQQAEQFRSWAGQQYTPRTGRMIGALKDAVDSDVETHGGPGLYEQGRALRTQRDQMLEGPSGISKLMANDKTGINRPVPLEQIPDNIVKMPKEQFDHVVNVLHDSAKLGNGELAEGSAAALNEIRGHMAARLHEAGSTGRDGMWDPYKYHERLNAYSLKMPSVFSPEGIDRFKTINEAGNALRMDKRYPGASAQAQVHAGMGIRERAGNLGTSMAEDLIPMGNTLGEISGASQKVRDLLKGSGGKKHLKEVEGRITKLGERPGATPNTPEGVTPAPNNTPENVSPLGQRLGGASQRGGPKFESGNPYNNQAPAKDVWGNERAETNRAGTGTVAKEGGNSFDWNNASVKNDRSLGQRIGGAKQRGGPAFNPKGPPVQHMYDKESGEHIVRSANGESIGKDAGKDIIEQRSDTYHSPSVHNRGEGTNRSEKLAEMAHARGGVLRSDTSVSPGMGRVYEKLGERGFKVEKNPNATINPDTGNTISDDPRNPVYTVGPKPKSEPQRTTPLGQIIGGGSQRGGPKFTPKAEPTDEPATLNVRLHQGTEGQPGFRKMSKQEATKAIEATGAKVTKSTVTTPKGGEPTLVASTNRALTGPEMQSTLAKTKQSAIPQRTANGEGEMHIAPGHEATAAEQGWDKYNPDYFREHNGMSATENATTGKKK